MFGLKSEAGFTLLEIILGTAVLGILAVAVMGYWQTSTGALEDIQTHHIATELAKNSLEKMKAEAGNLDLSDDFKAELTAIANAESTTITDYKIDFEREVSFSNPPKVKVTVSWPDSQVTLNTMITDKRNQEYALDFDGSDDYVEIKDSASLDITGPMTIEFWFKATAQPASGSSAVPVAKGTYQSGFDFSWFFEYLSDGKLAFSVTYDDAGNQPLESNKELTDNKWHHVAGVFTGTKQLFYLDGQLQDSININDTILSNNHSLLVAASHKSDDRLSEYTTAQLKEIRLWQTALSKAEIETKMYQESKGGEAGLVGYWKLDEGTGDIAYDYAGGNNGTISGAQYQKVFWWQRKTN
ncbi:LamG-like jellyroll fold domain-containing protein [Halanaerobacter jeridensis]|uniref:Prepilin-type N-terminal cleavage/methylation domain-containing protein n=1 Tax=Halanaerobacter jeridensis TaxID=706427 RepID=A0A939BND5_9FIRM|nr:LamG-like jellyroll fold domain-containing protein [Halanaerobacter jeridensis]MBM7555292.1 prepilin-type N-terminal cleavage/methylation domain-containing protein [Halanaerobacter jeridensis]